MDISKPYDIHVFCRCWTKFSQLRLQDENDVIHT